MAKISWQEAIARTDENTGYTVTGEVLDGGRVEVDRDVEVSDGRFRFTCTLSLVAHRDGGAREANIKYLDAEYGGGRRSRVNRRVQIDYTEAMGEGHDSVRARVWQILDLADISTPMSLRATTKLNNALRNAYLDASEYIDYAQNEYWNGR